MRAFLEAHAPLILRLARTYAPRGGADPRDVAQNVMLALIRWNNSGSFKPDTLESPEAYLRVVVRNAALRSARKRGVGEQVSAEGDIESISDAHADRPPTPEELTREAIDKRRWLEQIKAKLRPRDAVAFSLLVEDGLAIEDVAKALGTTPNNVYQMRHRILTAVRELTGNDSAADDLKERGS